MNQRVICRDWQGNALDRSIVGIGERVFYVSFSRNRDVISTDELAVGVPKGTVFVFEEGVAGRRLTSTEWLALKPYDPPAIQSSCHGT
jgi:hypothetical protein